MLSNSNEDISCTDEIDFELEQEIKHVQAKISCKKEMVRRGTNFTELLAPKGLDVDDVTGRIFVADEGNNRIQVFSSEGEHLFSAGRDSWSGNAINRMPYGICCKNNLVFVSQYNGGTVLIYTTDGNFISNVGGTSCIPWPSGLDVTLEPDYGRLLVCSSGMHCVLVFSDIRNYRIGESFLLQPRDVKLHRNLVYILDLQNPCLHEYELDGNRVRSFISNGIGKSIAGPLFFKICNNGLILMGDNNVNRLKAFTKQGKLVHEIGANSKGSSKNCNVNSSSLISHFVHFGYGYSDVPNTFVKFPRGLTIDSKGRIISVGLMKEGCLKIF